MTVVPDDDLSVVYYFRFFNDEKMAVWNSSVTGLTTKLGLEIWMVNSGSVSTVITLTIFHNISRVVGEFGTTLLPIFCVMENFHRQFENFVAPPTDITTNRLFTRYHCKATL